MKREIIITKDGSSSILLPEWNETYHSKFGAIQEAKDVFIKNGLDLFEAKPISILEIGFGTGLNAFISLLEAENKQQRIDYVGVEAYPVGMDEIQLLNYAEELNATDKKEVFYKMHELNWEEPNTISDYFCLTKRKQFFSEINDKNTFDLIITPWFIDVNGGDVRDLIGLIHEQLTNNGHWINSGPLLFTRHLPTQLKYTSAEIKEFIELSGFTFNSEEINNAGYLISPLEARFREEQVWTFSTQKKIPSTETIIQTHAWLIMHHLPIPNINFICRDSHPLIDIILEKVDGIRSINDMCFEIAIHIPEGIAVKDVVVTLFGQIISDQAQHE